MSSSGQRTASSLEALRRKVNLETLTNLQPLLLLQMLVSASQTVNDSVAQSQALARTFLLSGRQRLRDLLNAAPCLHLPVEQVIEFCHADDAERTPEENAAWALFELCLGLMLYWMAEHTAQRHTIATPRSVRRVSPSCLLSYPSQCPPRARSCLYLPLA